MDANLFVFDSWINYLQYNTKFAMVSHRLVLKIKTFVINLTGFWNGPTLFTIPICDLWPNNISICQLCVIEIPLYFLFNKHHHESNMHKIHVKLTTIYDIHSSQWQCNMYWSPKTFFNYIEYLSLVLSITFLNNFLESCTDILMGQLKTF